MEHRRRPLKLVSAVLILALLASVTVLFGAGQSAKITMPANKATVSGIISVKADVTNATQVAYVVLVVDDTRPASTNAAPCTFELDTRELSEGSHKVYVEAYSSYSLLATSKAITIYVKNQAAEPMVVAKQRTSAAKATAAAPASKAKATAVTPAAPLTRTAADGGPAVPKAVMTAEGVTSDAAVAPVVAMQGPAPEPTRTAALAMSAPRSIEGAELTALSATAIAPSATPPGVKLAQPAPVRAGRPVAVNGKTVDAAEPPIIIEGRRYSGFRVLFSAIGGEISWLPSTRTARSVSDSLTVEVPIGSRVASVNGEQVDMGQVAMITKDRTMVPVRFFAEATGSTILWDAESGATDVVLPGRAVATRAQ